jgi:hypothetical protein
MHKADLEILAKVLWPDHPELVEDAMLAWDVSGKGRPWDPDERPGFALNELAAPNKSHDTIYLLEEKLTPEEREAYVSQRSIYAADCAGIDWMNLPPDVEVLVEKMGINEWASIHVPAYICAILLIRVLKGRK